MTAIKKKLNPQNDGHAAAITAWLSGETSGHLGPYMYTTDRDDHRWKEGHSSSHYYVGRDDKATFDLMIKSLNVLTETLFDLGPGGEDSVIAKSLPIAEATMAANYVAVDLSPVLAHTAAERISRSLGIRSTSLVSDFFADFSVRESNAMIALLGGTLGNLETHDTRDSLRGRLTQIFLRYRRAIIRSGFFLVSFDANSNVQEILDCYNNPQLGELIRSGVDRSIETEDFDYRVSWTPHNYRLALGLVSKSHQIIRFNGEAFPIEQNEFLPVLNSYRFPVSFVTAAAADAGWKHWRTWSATGRMHYLLFTAST